MTPADFNENLTCSLCKSYLIDAVTLTECLHFFCRSCLLQHLTKESRCPTCASDLGSDLSEAFVRDEILQNLVYKMVPDVYWDELKQRSEFYKKKTLSKEEKQLMFNKKLLQLASHLCAPQELVSLAVEYIPSCPPECDEKKGGGKRCDGVGTGEGVSKCTEGCGVHEGEEPMEVDEEPKPTTSAEADRLEQRHKISYTFSRYYRCPASTRIGAIRKLLEAKLLLPDIYRLYFLDVECNQTLEDDCTLQDIAYMFSWKRDSPMRILFTLQVCCA
ncbi:hypothetical protein AB6A40_006223 [Gnathostoma spinigerum]|uniref:RING-type domain-containing protein n=1 Tax=Gnathostoma spinigerum TaxID=75299 RepID=A0ABD6EHR4_9BILA